MADSRATEILESWRQVADEARLPQAAPRTTHGNLLVGLAGTGVAVLAVLVVAVFGRTPPTPISGAIATATRAAPSASDTATAAVPTPSPSQSQSASLIPLPNPGGTCSFSQLVLGKPKVEYGYGTLFYDAGYVSQPLRNVGPKCTLVAPKVVGVATGSGPFAPVSLAAGPPTSFTIRAGASLSLDFAAEWLRAGYSAPSAPPCDKPVSNVTSVEFPLSDGNFAIAVGSVWRTVCTTPANVSLTVSIKSGS